MGMREGAVLILSRAWSPCVIESEAQVNIKIIKKSYQRHVFPRMIGKT